MADRTANGHSPETVPVEAAAPSRQALREQTLELGHTLKQIADGDPADTPSAQASIVFAEWLREAQWAANRPELFDDVAANYDAASNTNRDLFLLFDLLVNYLDLDDDAPPQGMFIGLPMLGA